MFRAGIETEILLKKIKGEKINKTKIIVKHYLLMTLLSIMVVVSLWVVTK